MVPLNKRVIQRTFIRIKAVFSLDTAAWLRLLSNFSLVIFFLSLVLLQGIVRKYSWTTWQFYRIWTSDCLNTKQNTFHCFRKTVSLMMLKREAHEFPCWKAGPGRWSQRGPVPLPLCLLASLPWFWIKETLVIDALCSRCLSVKSGDQNLSFQYHSLLYQ